MPRCPSARADRVGRRRRTGTNPVVGKRKSEEDTPNRVTLSAARLPPSQEDAALGFAPRPYDRFAFFEDEACRPFTASVDR